MDKSILIVSGEDIESEDEFDRPTALLSMRSQLSQLIVSGEALESDTEDFGSTISLGSSSPEASKKGGGEAGYNLPLDPKPSDVNIHPGDKLRQRDAVLYKKHIEKNKSLRHNFVEKALRPTLLQNIKKLDNVSQSLSNIQMAVQEVLLQSRVITENLNRIKREIEKFQETDKESSSDITRDSRLVLLAVSVELNSSTESQSARSALCQNSNIRARPIPEPASEIGMLGMSLN